MSIIKVQPISVDANGKEDYFGDETGTIQFYIVLDTLNKYLGEENVWAYWDYTESYFIIEEKDEGCDNTYDYARIIEAIYEPFYLHDNNFHLIFRIMYDE